MYCIRVSTRTYVLSRAILSKSKEKARKDCGAMEAGAGHAHGSRYCCPSVEHVSHCDPPGTSAQALCFACGVPPDLDPWSSLFNIVFRPILYKFWNCTILYRQGCNARGALSVSTGTGMVAWIARPRPVSARSGCDAGFSWDSRRFDGCTANGPCIHPVYTLLSNLVGCGHEYNPLIQPQG